MNSLTQTQRTLSREDLSKVSQCWGEYQDGFEAMEHWTGHPAVKARINTKITGDPATDLFTYVVRKYFFGQGRKPENCLSLGCGAGELERGLTKLFIAKRHLAIDVSDALINTARERANSMPHIQYERADLNTCEFEEHEYDLVIAHQSLHHISNLEDLFQRVRCAMRPGAVFAFDEYIGPRQFQWTDRQLECINGITQLLPPSLNRDVKTGLLRQNVIRCSPEQVAEVDPSEAIRSDEIVPIAARYLKIAEFRPYGGTILHMLLHMKAGNFFSEATRPWLEVIFQLEDLLIPELGNDFAAVICILPLNESAVCG